jgi:lipopolysaccharide export system protein LptA
MKALLSSLFLLVGVLAVAPVILAEEPGDEAMARLGFSVDRDVPLEIGADELRFEASEGGEERVVFRKSVEVVQGDLKMYAEQVEAVYPEGTGSRPSQIVATRSVRIVQAGVEARCGKAIFDGQCRVECHAGEQNATLRRGGDVLSGRRIQFDLCKGTLEATGRTRVQIQPKPKPAEKAP